MAGTRITITPAGEAVCDALGVRTAPQLLALKGGEVVAESRTTKTVRLATPAGNAYLKRYFVPTLKDWFRGALRWTWLGKSKAQREWENYRALEQAGWGTPERLAWADVATGAGALEGCGILTAEVPEAERLDVAWLKGGIDRRSLLNALGHRVHTALEAGWFDGNLHARNVLIRNDSGAWRLFKIDSPKGHMNSGRVSDMDPEDAAIMDLGALDAFGRQVCSVRERLRVLCRALRGWPRDVVRDIARNADCYSLKLQGREAARLAEARELARA